MKEDPSMPVLILGRLLSFTVCVLLSFVVALVLGWYARLLWLAFMAGWEMI